MYRGCSAQKKSIKITGCMHAAGVQRHVFTASVPKLFQTIEWAFLILCQKVRKIPVFKPNTGFSVCLFNTLDAELFCCDCPYIHEKANNFCSQVSTPTLQIHCHSFLGGISLSKMNRNFLQLWRRKFRLFLFKLYNITPF